VSSPIQYELPCDCGRKSLEVYAAPRIGRREYKIKRFVDWIYG